MQVCIPAQQMGNPEYLSQVLVLLKNGRQELETATALAALKDPREKSVLEQVLPTMLTLPIIREKMMHLWESK